MNTAAYLAWANQPAASLQQIQSADNRLLAAAAGQVLQALQARAMGDARLVKMHLAKGLDLWQRAQQRDELQVADARDRIDELRADGLTQSPEVVR